MNNKTRWQDRLDARRAGLARSALAHRGFRRLWTGQTISSFGGQVTVLAMPLAAVLVLHASTFQVGLLTTAAFAPFLVLGFPVGAWVDRHRRKPTMLGAELLRAVVLASIPVAALFGDLSMTQLYVVAALQGVGRLFFDIAYLSYLPHLVGPDLLADGTAKLQVSQSVAAVSGPSLSGLLVELLTAPVAIAVDAVSYLASALSLLAVPGGEPAPEHLPGSRMRAEIAEGLRFVLRHRMLRTLSGATATMNLFVSALFAIATPFLVRQLGLSAAGIGLVSSIGAVGGLTGALIASSLRRRFGPERVMTYSVIFGPPSLLLLAVATKGAGVVIYGAGLFLFSVSATAYNINQSVFRQRLCPDSLRGRVNATARLISWSTPPVGGILGGLLGVGLGDRDAILVTAIGAALSPLWFLVLRFHPPASAAMTAAAS